MKTGILLINTGTPDAPQTSAVRRYLREFLTDPYIISMPQVLWKPILHGFILPRRPKRTLESYKKIWTPAGSPFMLVSQSQREKLEALLHQRGFANGNFAVELAMRYGNPSIEAALQNLRGAECERVIVLPLYPQQVKVCTGTCLKKTHDLLDAFQGGDSSSGQARDGQRGGRDERDSNGSGQRSDGGDERDGGGQCDNEGGGNRRGDERDNGRGGQTDSWRPQVIDIHSYYGLPSYVHALADSVRAHWSCGASANTHKQKDAKNFDRAHWTHKPGSKLVLSFHSTLLADIAAGDPYQEQCEKTAYALAKSLNVPQQDCVVAYQSRFDNRKWLQPSVRQTLQHMGHEGVKDICVLCPGFSADCLESLIEIAQHARDIFLKAAPEGATFTYVPALNDTDAAIGIFADAIEKACKNT